MVAVCPAASFTRPRTLGTATLGAFVLAVTVVRAVDGAQLRPALEEHQHQKKKAYGWHQQHLASGGGVLARTSTAINGGAAIVTTACTAGQIVLDDCAFKNDDACDADSFVCNAGTDCFDCDPCRLYDDTSCDTCLNGGSSASTTTTTNSSTTTTPSCVWCAQPGGAAAGICASTDVAAAFPWVCSADGGTDFFDVCANVPVVEIPSCDIVNDICVFNEDLVCDVASNICPMGSDCFDCDPCLKLTSCQACTALNTNCTWCSTSDVTTGGVCSSLDIAAAVPNFCLDLTAGTAYSTTCTDTGGTTPTSPISSFSPSPTSLSTPAPSGSTLAPSPSLSTPTTTTTCNLDTDTCYSSFQFDLVCDADGSLCPLGSDCFDCDPCQLYAAVEDCNACVEAGCQYATYPTILGFFRAICSSPEIAAAVPNIAVNEGGTPYQSTCDGSGGGGDDDGGGEGTCNFATDSCMLQQNGACDADGTLCPISSDCFDCDPCKANNSLGCDACTQTTGCMWCSNGDDVTGQCSSTDSAKAFPNVCGTSGTTFSSVCNGGGGGGTSTTPYTCDATNDPCLYTMDGVCDANGLICALQDSDCVDCDPCQKYRFEGCEVCTGASEGCLWCDVDAMCKSPGLVLPGTMMTCAETDFVSTCPAPTTVGTLVFSDPLFGSMNWLYDQIKVKDVWASGISKLLLPNFSIKSLELH